jgi:molybdopterin adenylyltransferase
VEALGHGIVATEIVADDRAAVATRLRALGAVADLVLTTGGTGLAPRDTTPEATRDAVEREIPGLPEEIRRRSVAVNPRGILSRATAGILPGGALVLNLPGSPKGAVECLGFVAGILPHAVEVARGGTMDCAAGREKA